MTIKRRGFTLENSGDNPFGIATSGSDQPPSDTERIVEFINRLLANYGACLAALGERDKARETLDAALAADPNNAGALAARAGLDA